ncbi:Hsp70 family protein [Actinoplanes sp. NPDC048967]|uniref:Hsp70 family protein n=1 Tax=Actinoplanes sp. NPDC048967 TaxID=3155269 RepID=UPI00340464DA
MQYGLGIDLGTTQTAAAVRVDGRTEVVRLGGRRAEIPSLVFVRPDGGLLIGEAAERRGQAEPARLAREFKRRIGDPVPILAGGVPFSAHALTAKLLRHVLDTVIRLQDGPPAVLTVTHPANWGPYKREQLDQALRLADTGPALLRTEPEAAALQHATARRIGPGETVAVYDLGGGTFDAAVLRREGEGFQVLGEPEGIEQLGGADFDEAVFGHVLGVLGDRVEGLDPNEPDVVTALARLRRDCVEAKEALSFDTEVMIPVALPGVHTRVRLNRSELESMIAPALADTVAAMHRALRAARVAPGELDAVLLAGGSSRIPLIGQLLAAAFDRPVVADPHPEHSIAMGAAVATALVTGGVSPFDDAVVPPPPVAAAGPEPVGSVGADATAAWADPEAGQDTLLETPAIAGFAQAAGAAPHEDAGAATHGPTGIGAGPGSTQLLADSGTQTAPGTAADADAGSTQLLADSGTQTAPGTAADAGSTQILPGSSHGNGNGAAGATRILPGEAVRADRPVSGGAAQGPVAYSRGAASVPSNGQPRTTPTRTFPQPTSPAPPPPGPPPVHYPPAPAGGDRPPAKRNGKLLVLIGALTLAMIAGTTVLVALVRRGDKDRDTAAPPTASPSVSVPLTLPTAGMLIQVDAGGDQRPELKSSAYLLTPGKPGRTAVADTGGDVLPEWSRNRKRVAVIRYEADGSNAIWVMAADGGNPQKVVENATGGRVSWNPDGSKLAFLRKVDGSPQIFTIRIGDSKPTQLTWADGMKDDPAWSPGGGAIAYWKLVKGERQIFILNANDPEEPGLQVTKGDSGPGVDPNWSPDGMRIAYTRDPGDAGDIWTISPDGKNAKQLTEHEDREMDPSWAPDGSWLAFTRGPVDQPKIVVAKADGSAEQVLTEGDAREGHPCWS